MRLATRDPWADARQAATQPVLDRDAAAVRRRIWVRRVAVLVVGMTVLLGAAWALSSTFTPDFDYLWPAPWTAIVVGFSLAGVGLVSACVTAIRSRGRSTLERSFLGPEDFLGRSERAWVRTQVTEGQAVSGDRRDVVIAAARRIRAEGVQTGNYISLLCLYVGMTVAAPTLPSVIVFLALSVWMVVQTTRGLRWSRRARRWLALHAEPTSLTP